MKKRCLIPKFEFSLPPDEISFSKFLTQCQTSAVDDLQLNRDGVRFFSESPPPIKPSDYQLSFADLDTIKIIGKGSGGTVQLVQHKWTGQFFALKVFQMNTEESYRKIIAQEMRINQIVECPYVVPCYQPFYDKGVCSLILEYMDGGSLLDFLRRVKTIPEPYLAAICKQVLKGLLYLHHEKHIIHNDLNPSNLLINHRGEVKINDFGVVQWWKVLLAWLILLLAHPFICLQRKLLEANRTSKVTFGDREYYCSSVQQASSHIHHQSMVKEGLAHWCS